VTVRQERTAPIKAAHAPWVRTRLRAAPAAAWALALLVALTACLAAALPRAVDRYQDAALRRAVADARPDRSTVRLYAPQPGPDMTADQREKSLRPPRLSAEYSGVVGAVRAPLAVDPGQSAYGVRTDARMEVPDRFLARPHGLPAHVTLVAQNDLAGHSRPIEGRLPRATAGSVTAATAEVEAAVTAETAESLNIELGSVIHVPGLLRAPVAVRVTGIVTPREPSGAYWSTDPILRTPALIHVPGDPDRSAYWLGALLLAPEAGPVLLGTPGNPVRYWHLAPDPEALHGYELDRLKSAVAALESGPSLRDARLRTDERTDASTDLDEVLTSHERLRDGIAPLTAVAAFGAGTVALVVLVMAGGLAADRRRAELVLLRARGASLPGLAVRLLGETAAVGLPAAALGLTVAALALPGARLAPAALAALAVTAVACLTLPLRAAAAHRTVGVHTVRTDVTSVRPSRRRTVAELTLLVLAAGAVESLRRRGTAGGDALMSAAPVLVAVIAALLLVRLYPLPLRALARPAARLRGAVGHLSLARAGRGSVSAILPLLALSTALTTAAFGGSVLAGVREARDAAAVLAVGADARVESVEALPAGLPDRVRRTPGVAALTEVSIAYQARPHGRQTLPVAGVDPAAYAALADRTGLGAFPVRQLRRPADAGAPLPALASPAAAETYGTEPFPLRMQDGTVVTVRIALVRDRTPALSGTDFLVVDRAGLSREAARPTTLLLTGAGIDGTALRRAAEGPAVDVRLRSQERDRHVDAPVQAGAERVYAAAVAASAGYAVLTLLLSLLRTAPERRALLARLRTMGLTRAQGRRLLVLESLPQALLAALGGTLTGWATIRLLAPSVDLSALALPTAPAAPVPAELHTDPVSLAVPAVAVLLVTVGVAAAQAWWSGRRGSVTELRAGDAR
jgi:putative ABC transport system permease protein